MAIARATSIARLISFCTISRWLGEIATKPLLLSDSMWLPAMPTYAVVMVFPERRSARSSAAAMEVTVSSMFTTTPRRKPCEGQVPTPTIFSFPSRSSSPTRTQIFVVPTSIPTITRSCTIYAPIGRYTYETHYKYGRDPNVFRVHKYMVFHVSNASLQYRLDVTHNVHLSWRDAAPASDSAAVSAGAQLVCSPADSHRLHFPDKLSSHQDSPLQMIPYYLASTA